MSIPANRVETLNRTIEQEGQTLEGLQDRLAKARKQVEDLSLQTAFCQTAIEEARLELKLIGEANYANRKP